MIRQCIRPDHDIDAKITYVIAFRLAGVQFFMLMELVPQRSNPFRNMFLGIGGVSERYRFLRSLGAAKFGVFNLLAFDRSENRSKLLKINENQ